MTFTTTDVIDEVREAVQDTHSDAAYRRYSDAFLLRKVNQALKRLALLRPDLFTEVGTITCVTGSLQTAPANSIRLMDVLSASDGRAVKEVNQEVLDLMTPAWGAGAPGVAQDWMRYVKDPNRFYVYPPATTAETLTLLYAAAPTTYALAAVVTLQDAYMPAVVDCTAFLVESIDAENAESGRGKMFYDSFKELIGGSLQARKLTDVGDAGLDPKEVI